MIGMARGIAGMPLPVSSTEVWVRLSIAPGEDALPKALMSYQVSSWMKPPTWSDVFVPGTMNDWGNEPAPESGGAGDGACACAAATPTISATAAVKLPNAVCDRQLWFWS